MFTLSKKVFFDLYYFYQKNTFIYLKKITLYRRTLDSKWVFYKFYDLCDIKDRIATQSTLHTTVQVKIFYILFKIS